MKRPIEDFPYAILTFRVQVKVAKRAYKETDSQSFG